MTPLAAKLVKRQTMKLSQREPFSDPDGLLPLLHDFHCFEVTEAVKLVPEIAFRLSSVSPSELKRAILEKTFLPATRTWMEFHYADRERRALFLVETKDGILVSGFIEDTAQTIGVIGRDGRTFTKHGPTEWTDLTFGSVFMLLAIINTPRIVGRRQHMPHRGLERRLTAALKPTGKFPLHAWTEIKLEITPPVDMSAEGFHEAHLTGKRALHFCRAHLRVLNGQLVVVRGHWRGDASIGIKRSRYVLKERAA